MELLRKVILGFSATVYRTLQCLIYIFMRFFSSICITVDPFLMYNILIMCCLLIMYFRYCNSEFLKRPNAENLCDSLLDSLKQLCLKWLISPMDGPITNWAMLNFQRNQEKNEYPELVNIGSGSLHVLCGALKAGEDASNWNLSHIFKSMWKILDDSPARRGIYLRSCDSNLFPIMFCSARWVETIADVEKAVTVFQNIVTLIKCFQSLPHSKRPQNNKLSIIIAESINKSVVSVRMHFFLNLANILNTF